MKPVHLLLWSSLAVPLVGCGDAETPTSGPRPAATASPKAASVAAVFERGPSHEGHEAPIDHGFGLARLPASTLLAVRVVSVGGLSEAWSRLAVVQALGGFSGLHGLLQEPLAALKGKVSAEVPGGEALLSALERIEGEAVVGMTEVWPELAAGPSDEMPFAVAAFVELGAGEAELRRFLDGLVDGGAGASALERDGEDGFRSESEGVRCELRIVEGRACVWAGPPSRAAGALEKLLQQTEDASLAGTALLRQAPSAAAGESPWLEAYLQLAPLWRLTARWAPPEARGLLDALRLPSLEGVSFLSALDGDSMHDRLTLHTKGDDVVSVLLDQDPIDPDWARFVFTGADSGGIASFSPAKTLQRLRSCLPSDARRGLSEGLSGFQDLTGIDLVKDLLGRLGPHFVHGSRGDVASAMLDAEDFEAFVAIEVREADALQKLLDRAFQSGMLPVAPRPRETGGVRFHSIALPIPEAPPGLEPSFGFVGDALVIASSAQTFTKVVAAHASDGKATPSWLQGALAASDAKTFAVTAGEVASRVKYLHSVVRSVQQENGQGPWPGQPTAEQVSAFTKDLPAEWSTFRRVDQGFRFESRSPFGAALVSAAPLAVVAAVALPNLLQARLSSNENAAVGRLLNLHAAQETFKSRSVADRDGDGTGEYGTFGELTGAAPLPDGELLAPPILGDVFGRVRAGAVERSGYAFRVALPGSGGEPLGERDEGGAPEGVDTRMAEQVWLAYAYPVSPGATGGRVFFIDQTGHVLSTTNDAPGQGYSADHPPAFDAAFAADDRPLAQGGHVGRDGGFWTLAD